ncbi:19393_t:CDS:1, partial [Racocetra persica]
ASSTKGDSGATMFTYKDLKSVSLNGIHTGGNDERVSTSLPIEIIRDKFKVKLVTING